jgi:hypothetical protein
VISIPHALFIRLLNSATDLSIDERRACEALARAKDSGPEPTAAKPFALRQKDAAFELSTDRTTVWRITTMGILHPQEISPGTWRYKRSEVELLAENGYRHLLDAKRKVA